PQYLATQGTHKHQKVDDAARRVLHQLTVGARALNVAIDEATRHANLTNRGAGTVPVVNGDRKVDAKLDGCTLP
ncbi:ATP-binding protein, partial [Stenotrophomonas maltophilia]